MAAAVADGVHVVVDPHDGDALAVDVEPPGRAPSGQLVDETRPRPPAQPFATLAVELGGDAAAQHGGQRATGSCG